MLYCDYVPNMERFLPVFAEIFILKNFVVKLYSVCDLIFYPGSDPEV